jgi:nitroreductase
MPTKHPTMNLETFEQLTQRRRTVKVLAQDTLPVLDHRSAIQRVLSAAGRAPFHKVCSAEHREGDQANGVSLKGIEPWRFHALDAEACRKLRTRVIDREGAGKIPAMLASADAMIMATWLPNPSSVAATTNDDHESFEPTLGNVEHIAAASAAVQSLLLAATAAGFETYWSSGGVLRSPEIFSQLSIPLRQRLLGAIFLFPANVQPSPKIEIAESKLRRERHPVNSWSRWVEL